MAYYVVSVIVIVVCLTAITAIVIHALNKKGDVSAGFRVNQIAFTLIAKDRFRQTKALIPVLPTAQESGRIGQPRLNRDTQDESP